MNTDYQMPGAGRFSQSLLLRFWEKVNIPNDVEACWEWTAAIDPQTGYGRIGLGGRGDGVANAHRLSYEIHHVEALGIVCHRCGNKRCVNPLHLYDGSHSSNIADSWRLGERTFTPRMLDNVTRMRTFIRSRA